MKIRCCDFKEMANDILKSDKKIIMFGAGVIGEITVPEIIKENNLLSRIECYVDNDCRKWGKNITVYGHEYIVRSPEYLNKCNYNFVIFLNISRFVEVKEQLEQMECTKNMECYIMPMMCIYNMCSKQSGGNVVKTKEPVIPKKIHYMWLGHKEIPYNLRNCIDTWEKYCPDYEIIQWNEDNYDISKHKYMVQAYENKAYGFVPDYARIDILYNHGGIYLDTDIELIRSLDDMLYQEAFCGVEKWQVVNFGGCSGAIKGHPMIKKFLENRSNVFFLNDDGSKNKNTCGYYDTKAILNEGYKINGESQCINGMNIYAYDFFHPYDYMSGTTTITNNTYSIHHFNGGWLDEKLVKQNELVKQRYEKILSQCLEEK